MSVPPTVLQNTGWNIFGMAAPIAAALVSIPLVIRVLGPVEFGILAMGWLILGYFALFDLGLGRATTRFVAKLRASADRSRLGEVVWTSVHMHNLLGVMTCLLFVAITPWLVTTGFAVPPELHPTAFAAFYWLAASLPLIIVSGCLRGILEASNRFDAVNKIKVVASLVNYAAPLMVLPWTNDLVLIVMIICFSRILMLLALTAYCLREVPELRTIRGITRTQISPLFVFGGWVTISSLVAPIIMVTDRIFIAGIFNIGSVTYYVVPYEIVTKLWIFSASLMGAMFPVMSALPAANRTEYWRLAEQSERYLIAATAPIVGLLLVFSRELLLLWVGPDFAAQSTAVAKWLAFGVLVNVAAQAPITMVQAANRPDLIAKLQLAQLPIFIGFAWYMVHQFGSVGAAMAWACRACLEAVLARKIAKNLTAAPAGDRRQLKLVLLVTLFLSCCWAIDSLWRYETAAKLMLFLPVLLLFVAWLWRRLLTDSERRYMLDRVGLGLRPRG